MQAIARVLLAALTIGLTTLALPSAAQAGKIRLGLVKFGTVNWEVAVIQKKGLAQAEGVDLEIVDLANNEATKVAIQGGAVDMIVSDWLWVSRQRAEGHPLTFAPYSLTVGALIARPDSGVKDLASLAGKRLGVAGGPIDKSWLLLRAYSRKTASKDIVDTLQPNFAAPPLLNELIGKGELDAVLNFWHSARLKAAGMKSIVEVSDILPALGVKANPPLLGWVFDEAWAKQNRATVEGFLRASRKAKQLLKESNEAWDAVKDLTKAENDNILAALRGDYRAGIPEHFGNAEIEAAGQVFGILAELGGEDLIGKSKVLSPGTFWEGYSY
ncbi:MAG: ABC transporter substrate-binding protein [Gammaproteobacteria bacterium]